MNSAAKTLASVIDWLAEAQTSANLSVRALALVAATRPDLLDAAGCFSSIAAHFGFSRALLSKWVRLFEKELTQDRFHSRNDQTAEARAERIQISKRGWQRRKGKAEPRKPTARKPWKVKP